MGDVGDSVVDVVLFAGRETQLIAVPEVREAHRTRLWRDERSFFDEE